MNVVGKMIFFLSDLHFGIKNGSKEWLDNQLDYFNDFFFPKVKTCTKEKILIISGDLFDNRQNINVLVFNKVFELFFEFQKIFSEIHIIAGNHDVYLKYSNEINSLIAFKLMQNVYVYEKETIVTLDGNDFLMLPWFEDRLKERQIANLYKDKVDYVIAHTELKGFYYNPKVQVNKGHDISVFNNFKRVFSGHFHLTQEDANFIYLGSPMQYDRNDIGTEKRLYYFEPRTNELNYFVNTKSPVFEKINILNHLDSSLEDFLKLIKNNYIDLIVPDNIIMDYQFNIFRNLLIDYKKLEIKVIEKEKLVARVVNEDNRYSVMDLTYKYLSDNSIDGIEKDRIILYIKDLYEKVNK